MLDFIKKTISGNYSKKKIKNYQKLLQQIKGINYNDFDQTQILAEVAKIKEELKNGKNLEDVIVKTFALVIHAATKTIGETHFDVQVLGGLALHFGNIAEMRTGEGKTLTSTLPIVLNSLQGKGVHVVTVNDYLAKRDAEWMGKIYNYLGLEVGLIQNGMNDEERKKAYQADITYGTNNEFGFDYLRDNMKFSNDHKVQRGHHFAIIDEVDSILIDEARTPLIISGPTEESVDKYRIINDNIFGLKRASRKADNPDIALVAEFFGCQQKEVRDKIAMLKEDSVITKGDYSLDEKSKVIQLSEQGIILMEKRLKSLLGETSLFDLESIDILHHVNQALKAHYMFKKDIDYIVSNNSVKIVDEFTGRIMEGRRFSNGLHQALEAKEGVTVQKENQTLASITFQNYFRKYNTLSGMTGTAATEEDEFRRIYNLGVIVIPTNLPMVRQDQSDMIYKTKQAKNTSIVNLISEVHQTGQPILVGTDSIENSELYSRLLTKKNMPHEVLNAKNHAREAEIIASAGHLHKITIATNMAGRGTDIKLGPGVREKGGLFILGTVRHESRRIDNQLRGRSGRQGDPGKSRFILSLEDDLLRIFGGSRIIGLMNRLKIPDNEPIEHNLINKAIENAQKKVEAQNFSIRKHLLEYDDVMNRQREVIYGYRQDLLSENTGETFSNLVQEAAKIVYQRNLKNKSQDEIDISAWQTDFMNYFQQPPLDIERINKSPAELEDYIQKLIVDKRSKLVIKNNLDQMKSVATDIEKHIAIRTIDQFWKEHLMTLDHIRESIGLRSFAQKNPLDEYKKEAYLLFENTIQNIVLRITQTYFSVVLREDVQLPKLQEKNTSQLQLRHDSAQAPKAPPAEKKVPISRSTRKVGRNEPCPCGSGKKFKNCDCDLATTAKKLITAN